MGKLKAKKRSNKKPKKEIKHVPVGPKSRKDIRKDKRNLKKINKKEYFSKSLNGDVGKFVKAPKEDDEEMPVIKIEGKDKKNSSKNSGNKKATDISNLIMQENKGAKKREEKLKAEMREKRNSQLLKANEDEDKMIKKLEKQLHLKKKKSGTISKSFAEDGLGYILEVCDERTMQAAVAAEKHRAETGSGSDFEEDIAIATGKPSTVYQTSKPKKGKKSSDDQSSDDQFDDFGPSDDEDFDSEGEDLDSEKEQSFDEEIEKKDNSKKTNSKKVKSPKSKNKVSEKKTFTKSKNFASDSEEEDFDSEEERSFAEEVEKMDMSKKTNLKKVKSPKSKNKVNEKKAFAKSKDFVSDSESESSFDEEEDMKKANKVKKAPTKKIIDSPFPKSKNNIKGKKATVSHDDSEDESSFDEEEEIKTKKVGKLKKTLTKKQVDSPFPKCKVSVNGKKCLPKPEKQNDIKKTKGVAKQLVISDDSDDSEHATDMDADSDMENMDEEMEEEEEDDMHSDLDEQLRMIYTGLSGFPDESFAPGNLTPVREETAQDLDLYQKNIEEAVKTLAKGLNNATVNDMNSDSESGHENCCPRKLKKNWQEEDESDESEDAGMDVDADSDNLSPLTSENSECDNSDSSSDDSNAHGNNKQILVNGKIINTYGRNFDKEEDPEIVKCPKLDKMLENLSSTESECDKSFERAKIVKKDQSKSKADLKRKLDADANMTKNSKKLKQSDNIKPTEKISPKSKVIAKKTDNEKSKGKSSTLLSDSEGDGDISSKRKPIKTKKTDEKTKKISKVVQSDDEDSDDDIGSDDEDLSSEDEDFGTDLGDEMSSGSDSAASAGGKPKKAELWEDIYGRQRDQDGNVITSQAGKYIPPHLRAKKEMEDSKEIQQLKRQIKGLLNKVAASNMHWTGAQLEGLYSSSSRHAVNSAFCSLWLAALVQATTSSPRLAAEHTMLVAILHANVGSEVGAHFLQTVVKKFDEMLALEQNLEDKHLDNLILAISHLYSFKLFQAPLLYEILNKLLETLSEKSIECTLVALRSVGGVLRKEDPTALKTFIQTTQERASKFNDTSTKGSRVKFLLDVLLAIKNNNLNKIPNYDPSYTEELKKAMKGIIRKGNYIVPLNIKLEDLLRADERGKWWVVGSAWEGTAREEREVSNTTKVAEDTKHSQLMELALKQRINTDLRRNIFCIIMGAEDYMDAFEKLQQIGLKNQQEREIIHILIACCLQEKTYNPYYAVLAQKYCDYDRKFQMSIQYSIWDKLKEIDTYPPFQIANLGQFITHLFLEKGLPISILKVVQFADLTKATLRLMRQILLAILLHKRWQTCLEVFQRVAVSRKLHLFREGLRLFINHFLVKNADKKGSALSEEQKTLLQERASAVDKTLHGDSKLQF